MREPDKTVLGQDLSNQGTQKPHKQLKHEKAKQKICLNFDCPHWPQGDPDSDENHALSLKESQNDPYSSQTSCLRMDNKNNRSTSVKTGDCGKSRWSIWRKKILSIWYKWCS